MTNVPVAPSGPPTSTRYRPPLTRTGRVALREAERAQGRGEPSRWTATTAPKSDTTLKVAFPTRGASKANHTVLPYAPEQSGTGSAVAKRLSALKATPSGSGVAAAGSSFGGRENASTWMRPSRVVGVPLKVQPLHAPTWTRYACPVTDGNVTAEVRT